MASEGSPLGSSIGTKVVMGVTGLLLVGFVLVHMLGNLQIFLGPDTLNHYGELLRTLPELLWAARIVLLAAVVLHIASALRLTAQNRAARPQRYVMSVPVKVGIAPRTLLLTGLVIAAFVVYHLMHFTFLVTHPEFHHLVDAKGRHDVYAMVVAGFSDPFVSGFYGLAQVLLAMHLSHGVGSLFQTLGLATPRWRPRLDRLGAALAWIILVGNISIPAAVLLKLLPGTGGA